MTLQAKTHGEAPVQKPGDVDSAHVFLIWRLVSTSMYGQCSIRLSQLSPSQPKQAQPVCFPPWRCMPFSTTKWPAVHTSHPLPCPRWGPRRRRQEFFLRRNHFVCHGSFAFPSKRPGRDPPPPGLNPTRLSTSLVPCPVLPRTLAHHSLVMGGIWGGGGGRQ